jgi:glycosyltransferase involved in cell wall biosynthesis
MGKILLLSTGDVRGAYEVTYNVTKSLVDAGHEAVLLVKNKTKSDHFVIQVPDDTSLFKKAIKKVKSRFFPNRIASVPKYSFISKDEKVSFVKQETILNCVPFTPDLILAGMTDEFVNSTMLAGLKKATNATVLTWLVDIGPLTGGCHFSWDCDGYMKDCKNCPAILDDKHKNLPVKNLTIKLKNVREAGIQVLAGSQWVADQASASTLYKNQKKIFNTNSCIDTNLMNNRSRAYAKHIFGFPEDAKIIFAGSQHTNDPRKGIPYFVEALLQLWKDAGEELRQKTHVLVIGGNSLHDEHVNKIPFKKLTVDFIKDYHYLSLAYQAADVFVCPSIEDPGPMMVAEAMACGTPVVAFEMGIANSLVENGHNGYKAKLKNVSEMAAGIFKIITAPEETYSSLSANARQRVIEQSSQEYAVTIFNEILKAKEANN